MVVLVCCMRSATIVLNHGARVLLHSWIWNSATHITLLSNMDLHNISMGRWELRLNLSLPRSFSSIPLLYSESPHNESRNGESCYALCSMSVKALIYMSSSNVEMHHNLQAFKMVIYTLWPFLIWTCQFFNCFIQLVDCLQEKKKSSDSYKHWCECELFSLC